MRVIVVGAGVSGLTCALVLQQAGFDVEVWAAQRSPNTTSDVAAAVWYPLRGERDARAEGWMRISYDRFMALATDPAAGIIARSGIELFRARADDTWWRDILPGFRHASPDELPPGYADGFVASRIPVIEMPVYLRWLAAQLETAGARIVERRIDSLDEPLEGADIVVNCSGVGARALCGDDEVFPIRGQVVRVEQFGLDRYILDEANPAGIAYVYPRAHDVVLGGTREPGAWSLEPDPAIADGIIERCAALEPRVRDARVLSHGVGLRPGRPTVRLEAEVRPGGLVVHDYGHGGSGVTLSWGCAAEVARLVGSPR